ncbi:hypothetical protein HMPREF3166_01335 [Corynebacterium sp. HMSC08A12]|uniref:hypothetical protein n=1 Tax=Corynebacterium sp. HMSC08A12 TaxID=1581134 RepID=UPI0008A15CD1|nr:hypothetical protein [Corynebacterium sp. HMSC08A12]OFT36501.1 hypothetical protein HMPREF3166_01335 [Corynebacterium sp. HMSC08A12]
MTTVYVDLVKLDGSRPEGVLRFSLERMALGDPDVVPSSVEVEIRDGKARVDDLLPGAMRARVSTGGWTKAWHVKVPEAGEYDLFDLLEWQAEDFQETAWAALGKRVERLEQAPAVDLAPLEDTTRDLGNRVTALEAKPDPQPFDPSALQAQFADLQSHLTPVDLLQFQAVDDLDPVWELGATASVVQHAGRVSIDISTSVDVESLIRALNELKLPHFPEVAIFSDGSWSNCSVELFQEGKFLTKLRSYIVHLSGWGDDLKFRVEVDKALAIVREVGADRMSLSTFYYTNEVPPHDSTS